MLKQHFKFGKAYQQAGNEKAEPRNEAPL